VRFRRIQQQVVAGAEAPEVVAARGVVERGVGNTPVITCAATPGRSSPNSRWMKSSSFWGKRWGGFTPGGGRR